MDYQKYSKSLVESFQKTFFPEKDWVTRHKSIFNPDVHASMQLTFHRVAGIGAGLTKTLDELSNNKIFVDPKTNIKPVLTAMSSIMNDIEKTLTVIQSYNTQFAQKYKRVLPEPNRESGEPKTSRLKMFTQSRALNNNQPSLNATNENASVTMIDNQATIGQSGARLINNTLNKILGQLKTSQTENTELLTDQIAEQKYLANRESGVRTIERPNPAERKNAPEKSGGLGGFGSLIGAVLKPIESFLSPMAKLLPGLLRLMGMNKVAGLMGRIPGLGLLTTATAGVVAIDYLNKNPEVVESLLKGVQDVVSFAVDGIGRLVGDNLPQTAKTVSKLIVGGVSAIYHGFVESLKSSITAGDWLKATSEIALFGGVVWMAVRKLKNLASKFEKMIPSSFGVGGTAGDLVEEISDDVIDYGDFSRGKPKRTPRRTGKAKSLGKRTRGLGKKAIRSLKPSKLLKGGVAGVAAGLAMDVGLGLAEDAAGIDEENRYQQTGGKAALVATSDILSTTASFAAMGAMFGPVGAGLGALAGVLKGSYDTFKAYDDANGKSREAIEEETRKRLELAGTMPEEAKVRSEILAELIDSETWTKRGNAETQKAVDELTIATENLKKAQASGDDKEIAGAQFELSKSVQKLKEINWDVFKRQDELIVGSGLGGTTEQNEAVKKMWADAGEMMAKKITEEIKKNGLTPRGGRMQSFDVGGDVSDGLHSVGENGMELYYKKGSQTKVFNRADSNLKGAIGDEFARLGNDRAVSITKEIAENTSDSIAEIGKVMESTVASLLTQMSEIQRTKPETSAINNNSNQNVVNNFNNNNSVIANKPDSYTRAREFIPRFA